MSGRRSAEFAGSVDTEGRASGNVRLAYLVSRYPAISHTFIMREVLRLRACGFDVSVASINAPDREREGLTGEDGGGSGGSIVSKLGVWRSWSELDARTPAAPPCSCRATDAGITSSAPTRVRPFCI